LLLTPVAGYATAERDAPALEAALKARAGAARCDLVILEGASHNLKPVGSEGGHAFFGPVVPACGKRLVGWLDDVLPARPS
jgi:hypothetical protein